MFQTPAFILFGMTSQSSWLFYMILALALAAAAGAARSFQGKHV
jgi:hypothetical protein